MSERCFIIPVYNHAQGIHNTITKLEAFAMPCIVVDDGSDAECASVIAALEQRYPYVEVVRHERNRGKGAAVKTALRQAHARGFSHTLQIDADEQHDTAEIPSLLAASEQHPDAIILGEPQFDASVPRLRLYSRYLTHVWVWINTLSLRIRDAMCGFRIYPVAQLIELLDARPLGDRMEFDIEVLVALRWRGARFVGVPVHTRYPEGGVSHFRLVEDNWFISKMHARCFFTMLANLPRALTGKV